jgi:hypothetical protein
MFRCMKREIPRRSTKNGSINVSVYDEGDPSVTVILKRYIVYTYKIGLLTQSI